MQRKGYAHIQAQEFDAGVLCGKAPVNGSPASISVMLPSGHLAANGFDISNAAVEALTGESTEFDLCDIEPASVFRSEMDLEPIG